MHEIRHYLTSDGKDIVLNWLQSLRDTKVRIAIDRRINRMESDNFGDHRFCRDDVWELRIDLGPGYRVDYSLARAQVVLLLAGGDKRTQDADIKRVCANLQDWQRRLGQ